MEHTLFFVLSATSLADTMTKAALNTVISMSVVFAVLVLIIFLISGFKIIPYLEAKKKEQANKSVTNTFENQIEQREELEGEQEELVDDTELVAVIAAAIAAYTGTSTDDFVVRSIKRSTTNKWKKA